MGEDVEVCVQSQAEAATICADPNQLEQVLMNLRLNSRDAMRTAASFSIGRALWNGTRARPNCIGGARWPHVMLAVSDTGEGHERRDARPHLRNRSSPPGVGKGTGLGLSTIHGIVEQSGGCIEVASEPGRGTTFKIYMPRVADAPAESGRPEAIPRWGRHRNRAGGGGPGGGPGICGCRAEGLRLPGDGDRFMQLIHQKWRLKLQVLWRFKLEPKKAGPVLLEPVMAVEVVTPEEYLGDVMGDLSSRRGKIEGMTPRKMRRLLRRMYRYQKCWLCDSTSFNDTSRSLYTMQFSHYEPVQRILQKKLWKKFAEKVV